MQIVSTRFGDLEIDPDSVVNLPNGLPGFENCTRFKLFHEEGKPLVQWLQSLDDPDISFSVVDPSNFNIFYELELTDEEEKLIGLEKVEDAVVMLMVYRLDNDTPTNTSDPELVGSNVRASVTKPLVVNIKSRLGFQKLMGKVEQLTIVRAADGE